MYPEKFDNVTNGIAHRRWLCYSNPGLASLLDQTIGPDYRKRPETLSEFSRFASDPSVLERLEAVKQAYLNAGFKFIEQEIKGEWSALVLKKDF